MAAFNSNPPACHRFLITPLEAAANYPQAGGCVPGVTSPAAAPLPLARGLRGRWDHWGGLQEGCKDPVPWGHGAGCEWKMGFPITHPPCSHAAWGTPKKDPVPS